MPQPMVDNVVREIVQMMWPRLAPSAIRIPSSFLRRVVEKRTVLAMPKRDNASAMPLKNENRMERSRCCIQMG